MEKLISSPVELICYICAFIRYWVGLQGAGTKEDMMVSDVRLQQATTRMYEVASVYLQICVAAKQV
jgi:hypothetical protein